MAATKTAARSGLLPATRKEVPPLHLLVVAAFNPDEEGRVAAVSSGVLVDKANNLSPLQIFSFQ